MIISVEGGNGSDVPSIIIILFHCNGLNLRKLDTVIPEEKMSAQIQLPQVSLIKLVVSSSVEGLGGLNSVIRLFLV